jgi:hypothetical protein
MPRFFFHIVEHNDVLTDEVGLELPDVVAARREAVEAIASFVRDVERGGPDYGGKSLHVVSQDNRATFTLPIPRRNLSRPGPEHDSAPIMPASLATHRPGNVHGAGGLAQPLSEKDE